MLVSTALLLVLAAQEPVPPPMPAAPEAAVPTAPAEPVAESVPAPAEAAPTESAPAETAPAAPAEKAPTEPTAVPPGWDDIHEEARMTAEGGIDVCEALSLPLSLVPGIGDAVGTVTEWLCIVPAAIALDTVALQYGNRDATLWQATVSLLVQKLFEDLIDTPLTILIAVAAVAAVGTLVGSVLISSFVVSGFPIFVPTLIAVGAGTLLVTPVALLKKKGGELIFDAVFFGLTNQLYGDELEKKKQEAMFKPGDESLKPGGWARVYVLMAAAAGSKGRGGLAGAIPVVGPFIKAGREAEVTKERMRRVGRDVLQDPPGRDLSGMDSAVDAITAAKGITAGVGQALAIGGLAVGVTGAILPAVGATDQPTGDTIGFIGLGVAVAGLGVFALSTTADTVKTLTVPCLYGCFE